MGKMRRKGWTFLAEKDTYAASSRGKMGLCPGSYIRFGTLCISFLGRIIFREMGTFGTVVVDGVPDADL